MTEEGKRRPESASSYFVLGVDDLAVVVNAGIQASQFRRQHCSADLGSDCPFAARNPLLRVYTVGGRLHSTVPAGQQLKLTLGTLLALLGIESLDDANTMLGDANSPAASWRLTGLSLELLYECSNLENGWLFSGEIECTVTPEFPLVRAAILRHLLRFFSRTELQDSTRSGSRGCFPGALEKPPPVRRYTHTNVR